MKKILIIFAFIFGIGSAHSQENCLLEQKAPNHLVIDRADVLNPQQEKELESYLVQFSKETSNQILVVTVNSLCGYDKSEFTYTLGEKWGVGQKGFDNGIVVMVKPHGKAGDRHTFIAVGYGLEGVIPDATAKRIVSKEMIPYFKKGEFFNGIGKSVQTLAALAKGEINSKAYNKKADKIPIFPILFVLGIIFLVFFSNVQRVRKYSVGHNMSFWAAMMLMSQTRHRSGGGWNNFNSGGGSFGGGFGGFGGGSFGGGGAGGSW